MTSIFKALADPRRRQVLQMLRAGPMGAGALADAFDVSKPTMSAHFAVLVAADLIEAEKSGRTIMYRLKMSVLEEALMGFAQAFGLQVTPETPATTDRRQTKENEMDASHRCHSSNVRHENGG
jgi:DNA-binding transcriptional ArsR family regulator